MIDSINEAMTSLGLTLMEAIALTDGNRVLVPIATKWLASGIGDDDDDDEHSSAGIVFWYMTVQLVET